jgi:hypothetical protein
VNITLTYDDDDLGRVSIELGRPWSMEQARQVALAVDSAVSSLAGSEAPRRAAQAPSGPKVHQSVSDTVEPPQEPTGPDAALGEAFRAFGRPHQPEPAEERTQQAGLIAPPLVVAVDPTAPGTDGVTVALVTPTEEDMQLYAGGQVRPLHQQDTTPVQVVTLADGGDPGLYLDALHVAPGAKPPPGAGDTQVIHTQPLRH